MDLGTEGRKEDWTEEMNRGRGVLLLLCPLGDFLLLGWALCSASSCFLWVLGTLCPPLEPHGGE